MSWTLSCHLVFLSTAAIVSETSPPTLPSSEHQNRNKNNGKFRAQDLLLKHTAPIFACCWHIQPVCILLRYGCRSAACTARMRTVFPPWFSPLIPNRFHLPPFGENTDYIDTHAVAWESPRRPLSKIEKRAAREMETNWVAGGWTARSSWLRLAVTSALLHPFSFPRTGFPPVLLSSPLFLSEVDLASPLPPRAVPGTRHSSRQMQYELKTCLL